MKSDITKIGNPKSVHDLKIKVIKKFSHENRRNPEVLEFHELNELKTKMFSKSPFKNYFSKNSGYPDEWSKENLLMILDGGIVFTYESIFVISGNDLHKFNYTSFPDSFEFTGRRITLGNKNITNFNSTSSKFNDTVLKRLLKEYSKELQIFNEVENQRVQQLKKIEEQKKEEENKKREVIKNKVNEIITQEFDKDGNGVLDILEGDNVIMELLEKYEKEITEFDYKQVQNFIKLDKFMGQKKKDLETIFDVLKGVDDMKNYEEIIEIFRKSIENYNLLLIHSLNMIVSLKDKKMIIFYEIFETFDKLNVFNSNWENEISQKLISINDNVSKLTHKLEEVIFSIKTLELNLSSQILNLSYITKLSYEGVKNSVTSEIKSLQGSMGVNNLLTGIQTYQSYLLRKGK